MTFTPTFKDLTLGSAMLTVTNGKGEHITFKVAAPKKTGPKGGRMIDRESAVRFVSIKSGESFLYVGMLSEGGIVATKGSKLPANDRRVAAVAWVIRQVVKGAVMPDGYCLMHEGKCLRCGRTLTNPDSITSGIGPECRGKENESVPLAP